MRIVYIYFFLKVFENNYWLSKQSFASNDFGHDNMARTHELLVLLGLEVFAPYTCSLSTS